jgi:2'-5' RNA ligase
MANGIRPTETAVVVQIPAIEFAVAEHRRSLDVAALWGVPAHVSVLYPFVHPDEVDEALIDALGAALRTVDAFDCAFSRCEWFGEEVVWIAPEPSESFRELTASACDAFPNYQPYGGAFDDVVPHLTIGGRRRGTLSELRAAEAAVRLHLPISTHIDRVALIAGTSAPDSWRTLHEFSLGLVQT